MTLVERLREMASVRTSALFSQRKLIKEAADRIESLEAELEKAREAALEEAAGAAYDALSNTSGFVSAVRRERVTAAIRSLSHKEG